MGEREIEKKTVKEYIQSIYPQDEMLDKVKASIIKKGMPNISISPGFGRLLSMLVKLSGAKQVLEIGALGGYSGICLARELGKDGKLISLELKQEYADVAKKHLAKAGLGDLVEYRIGDAKDSLVQLEKEERKFDFFFIDADKENYPLYLEWALKLGNPGAIIAADNTLMRGRAYDESIDSPAVQAVRRFNEQLAQDDRLQSTLLPAFDGISLAMIK